MIEWIKFKGSTEEERALECPDEYKNCIFLIENCSPHIGRPNGFHLTNFTHWAPLNLPEEEKWEREYAFNTLIPEKSLFGEKLNEEFDNIYSILNELRKK